MTPAMTVEFSFERRDERESLRALVRERPAVARVVPTVDSAWAHLVRGEWTLVDQFDADGERHVIAEPRRERSAHALSAQQERVARAAGEGLSCKEIAKRLQITERAADNQLRRALQKLGLDSRVQLVRLWATLERAGQI